MIESIPQSRLFCSVGFFYFDRPILSSAVAYTEGNLIPAFGGGQSMTNKQKDDITQMRGEGLSYSKIATLLAISENTVKSFCRTNNLGGKRMASDDDVSQTYCTPDASPEINYEKKPILQEQLQKEVDYVRAQRILESMLENGLISLSEFNKITALNRQTFSPALAKIMTENR